MSVRRHGPWTEIRRLVLTKQKSKRAICQEYRLHWKTLQKILTHAEPPGYQQRQARAKPKLGHLLPVIHELLEQDKTAPPKQRHTIKRIFERLQTEHQYHGGISVVGDAVRAWRAGFGRGLHAAGATAGRGPGRLRRSDRDPQGQRDEDRVLRDSLPFSDAMFCQVFRENAPRRFKRDTVERLSSSAASRRESATTIVASRSKPSCVVVANSRHTSSSDCKATFCSRITSAVSAGRTRRAASKGVSASHAATSWCRFRESTISKSSTSSWSTIVAPTCSVVCVVSRRPSKACWKKSNGPCCRYRSSRSRHGVSSR